MDSCPLADPERAPHAAPGWAVVALGGNPNAGTLDLDLLWNLIIQNASYIGVAFGEPYSGVGWFGDHTIRSDNLILEGAGLGTP